MFRTPKKSCGCQQNIFFKKKKARPEVNQVLKVKLENIMYKLRQKHNKMKSGTTVRMSVQPG